MAKVTVLNGPNLNLLGTREPGLYGTQSLQGIQSRMETLAEAAQCELAFYQSNAEHELVEYVHTALRESVDFIVINPAAFTHTSIALRDALLATRIPFIEVHLSNVYGRETFRKQSYFSDIARGVISGLGAYGYELAMQAALQLIDERE